MNAGMSTRIRRVEDRMRPGAMSTAGFLGENESLRSRLRSDSAQLRSLGIRPRQIANRLECLVAKSERILGLWLDGVECGAVSRLGPEDDARHRIVVEGEWSVSKTSWNGYQECPFLRRDLSECDTYDWTDRNWSDSDILVTHARFGEIAFPGLMMHLLRAHRFFEGMTRYRLDPSAAVRVLDLRPGVDYHPTWSTEKVWSLRRSGGRDNWAIPKGSAIAEEVHRDSWVSLAPGTEVVVLGSEMVLRTSVRGRRPGPIQVDGHRVCFPFLPGLSYYELEEHFFVAP